MLSTSQVLNSRGQAYSSPWAAIALRASRPARSIAQFPRICLSIPAHPFPLDALQDETASCEGEAAVTEGASFPANHLPAASLVCSAKGRK